MARVAILSNPQSTGNRQLLPKVREFCSGRSDLFHYEVEDAGQIGEAMRTIAMVEPKVIVINGGDGTVQAALTELYGGDHFVGEPPPVAVLPNGKTNLIAMDLGAEGDPLVALHRVVELAAGTMDGHLTQRQLIALADGSNRPVLGMFLGGAYLADVMLYCRHKIYPLGLPNGLSHLLAALMGLAAMLLGGKGKRLPVGPQPMRISLIRQGEISGRFSMLIVTTLEKLLLSVRTEAGPESEGRMRLLAVDRSYGAIFRLFGAARRGALGQRQLRGVHFQSGDEIRIEGDRSSVILDGEIFQARPGRPIVLTSTRSVPFVRLAA